MKKTNRNAKSGKLKIERRKGTSGSGFTIIEVLIVLAIAGLILMIVFLAVPALQRNLRNSQRKKDASLLYAAVNECLTSNFYNFNRCDEITELPIDISRFSISTGAHFGASCLNWQASGCAKTPPTLDEPNWLSNLICLNGDWLQETDDSRKFVVGYFIETPGTPGLPPLVPEGASGRCL